ncbi:MAG: sulfoxide reductase heme-binding subunit YedZ [Gemmatimonadota bacterium]|nr:sulfoxide reductase heme-binding subunit YedZ [Gemmatimonadota bacterium]MDH5759238.1 sulfoxide reductase heme-binding subunit YedZ [Gemmatimonadota bacterium]
MDHRRRVFVLKAGVWLACLIPLGRVTHRFFLGDGLGANPIEELEHWSGFTALWVLTAALGVTPLRRITGWNDLQKVRRLVGLFAFFYAFLHMAAYLALDQFFAWSFIVEDVVERPFITVGTAAFLMLVPLALTSTRGWIRRLGRTWVRLHRLVYASAVLGVIHFFWKERADTLRPWYVALAVGILLGVRAYFALRARWRGARA